MNLYKRALILALHDQKLRYRRAFLGPLWITITNGMVFAVIGIVFSQVLGIPASTFIPYFATGQVCWNFFALHISECTNCMIAHEAVIKNSPQPYHLYIFRVLFRNILYLGHSLISLALIVIIFPEEFSFSFTTMAQSLFGLIMLVMLAWSIGMAISLLATRWRDMIPLIQNVLTVGYLATPILWKSSQVGAEYKWLITYNPLALILDMIRAPLLSVRELAHNVDLMFLPLSISILALVSTLVFNHLQKRIIFWL